MSARIIDGNKIAERIKDEVKSELTKIGKTPNLVAVSVGENPGSLVYIKNQKASCEALGINYRLVQLPNDVSEESLIGEIKKINGESDVTGVIVQMPLPAHVNSRKIQMALDPRKDVEGITPENLGKLLYADVKPVVAPCTALSVMECLKSTGESIKGKDVVIVGHSEIVGKPVGLMFLSSLLESATPTVCHIATKNLSAHTKRADILVVAAGKPGLVKGDMIKDGAIVIDVGINRITLKDDKGQSIIDEKTGKPKMKIVGDVVFEEAAEVAGYITPVPGGVGSVTTILLMKNLLNLFKLQMGQQVEGYKLI